MMKEILDFFLKVEKLKKIQRTGWVWRKVKNPETIAQHTFRVSLMNWFLGAKRKAKLNLEKVIKISLAHDLCEVYVGDITPYWGILPQDPKEREKILKRWIRMTKKDKEKRAKIKFEREKRAMEKLTAFLPLSLKNSLMRAWQEYEKCSSLEGKFAKQGDKIETLLQAIEYFGPKADSPATAWWEEVEDLVEDPILLDFLTKIEKRFYGKKREKEPILEFLILIGKLKSLPRRGWVIRKIKNPETIADHSFMVALMVWILGQDQKINLKRALKMALIHEISALYAGDYTPQDKLRWKIEFLGPRFYWKKFWQKTFKKSGKIKRFQLIYQKETKALQKLIKKLPPSLKQEIFSLWEEFNEKKSNEGIFVDQVNALCTFLQACEYWKENKNFPIKTFGEKVAQFVWEPHLLEFLEKIKEKFKLA